MKQAVTREKITRYLLGRLPEAERSELTDRYFEDDDFFAEIMAVKDELLDEYRCGLLEPKDRAAFEDFLLKYPPAGHELALAKALDAYALEHENELGSQSSTGNLEREALPPPRSAWERRATYTFAAAAVVLFVSVVWLGVNNRRIVGDLARVREELNARVSQDHITAGQAAKNKEGEEALRSSAEQLQAELDQERKDKAALEAQLRRPRTLAASTPTVSFTVRTTREAVEPRQLVLPSQKLKFEVNIEAEEGFERFFALIQKRDDGAVVWPSRAVRARRNHENLTLSFEVPASLFKAGTVYKLTIIGLRGSEDSEELGYEYFKVAKK